jgi:hypothetical protein
MSGKWKSNLVNSFASLLCSNLLITVATFDLFGNLFRFFWILPETLRREGGREGPAPVLLCGCEKRVQ